MGMRANISFKNNNGEIFMTTVQWATMVDRTVGVYLAEARSKGEDLKEAMKILASEITRYEHISCVDVKYEGMNTKSDRVLFLSDNVFIDGVLWNDKAAGPIDEDEARSIRRNHLESGCIGFYYTEGSDKVGFIWLNDEYRDVVFRYFDLAELADFYENGVNDSSIVLDLPFRCF